MKIENLHCILPETPIDAENWDIEKWRKEHPVDYFKLLPIFVQYDTCEQMAIANSIIHCATRLYLPKVLYKYYSLSNDEKSNMQRFQTLSEGKIYMSRIDGFNDPFDGKALFYDPKRLSDIERLKPNGGIIVDDFTSYIRATCLTANGVQSMPMWAHYSNNHAGFCVAYNVEDNLDLQSLTFPVQYTDERLDMTSLMRKHAESICCELDKNIESGKEKIVTFGILVSYIAQLMYNVKHSSWNYENEFRCIAASTSEGMPYINAKPKKIYIGMNCSAHCAQRLLEIGNSFGIPVYKMEFDEFSEAFNLVPRKYEL